MSQAPRPQGSLALTQRYSRQNSQHLTQLVNPVCNRVVIPQWGPQALLQFYLLVSQAHFQVNHRAVIQVVNQHNNQRDGQRLIRAIIQLISPLRNHPCTQQSNQLSNQHHIHQINQHRDPQVVHLRNPQYNLACNRYQNQLLSRHPNRQNSLPVNRLVNLLFNLLDSPALFRLMVLLHIQVDNPVDNQVFNRLVNLVDNHHRSLACNQVLNQVLNQHGSRLHGLLPFPVDVQLHSLPVFHLVIRQCNLRSNRVNSQLFNHLQDRLPSRRVFQLHPPRRSQVLVRLDSQARNQQQGPHLSLFHILLRIRVHYLQ